MESANYWREILGIEFGITKQEALDRFVTWRTTKKTCQRCEGEKLVEFCEMRIVCKEADDVRNAEGDDNRSRVGKVDESKTVRTELSSERKRIAVRQIVREEKGLS